MTAISIHALLAESDQISKVKKRQANKFLSTLSLRRATQPQTGFSCPPIISIHALLAESDSRTKTIFTEIGNFYPRSPCGERLGYTVNFHAEPRFLSTLSLRRATRAEIHANSQQEFLSTLSLRRATGPNFSSKIKPRIFLSTLSLRRATPPAPPGQEF